MVSLAMLALTAGCSEDNPLYCGAHDDCASGVCIEETATCAVCECGDEAPVCDRDVGTCRACLSDSECPDQTPLCRPDGTCGECDAHSFAQCPSGICDLTTNFCVAPEQVIFASAREGVDGDGCGSLQTPCQSVGGADGALAQRGEQPFLRLFPGEYVGAAAIESGQLHILGEDGVSLSGLGVSGAAVLTVRGDATLRLEDLQVVGGTGESGFGVVCEGDEQSPAVMVRGVDVRANAAGGIALEDCAITVEDSVVQENGGPGVVARTGGTVVVRRSRLSGNAPGIDARAGSSATLSDCELLGNTEGLVASDATARVERCRFLANGDRGLTLERAAFTLVNNIVARHHVVGIELIDDTLFHRRRELEHNTVVGGGSIGIACELGEAEHLARNNIAFDLDAAVTGDCQHRYSLIEGGAEGEGNLDADPEFVDSSADNYHLQPTSPCIDAGDPKTSVTDDIDGDVRPQGEAPDIGADEVIRDHARL